MMTYFISAGLSRRITPIFTGLKIVSTSDQGKLYIIKKTAMRRTQSDQCIKYSKATELSEMFNHKVRNINCVLLIYTDSGIYISQTFFGNGSFAFENSTAKQAVVYYW